MISSSDPEAMLHTMMTVEYMLERDNRALPDLDETRRRLEVQQQALDAAVANQQAQLRIMEANKQAAEEVLH